MLFTAATLRGLTDGRVSCTYRRWDVVRPKVGSRFTTSVGVVEVTSISPAEEDQLTERDAADAAQPSLDVAETDSDVLTEASFGDRPGRHL